MELNENEVGIPLRGKSLPLKVIKEADYKTLLDAALKKRADYDQMFDCERAYKLVFPDGQSAKTIPGALAERFTLVKYKEGLGKSYGRITLYLCPTFPLSNNESFKEECSYESDSEGKSESGASADFPLGISNEDSNGLATETIEIKDGTDLTDESSSVLPTDHANCDDLFYSTDFM